MNDKKDEKLINKVCPIFSTVTDVVFTHRDNLGMVNCLKEACAFYHTLDERGCAILIMSTNISKMWNYGLQIMRK